MIISNTYIKQGLDFAGKHLHAPEQRLILGATALATQPVIDLKNKEVDEKTRMTSVARTIAKIVAGTFVGVIVRYAGIKGAKAFTKYQTILNPKNKQEAIGILRESKKSQLVPLFHRGVEKLEKFPIDVDILEKHFTKYTKAMGIFAATIAMVFTNFLCDAPLTKYLTKVFSQKITQNKEESGVHK